MEPSTSLGRIGQQLSQIRQETETEVRTFAAAVSLAQQVRAIVHELRLLNAVAEVQGLQGDMAVLDPEGVTQYLQDEKALLDEALDCALAQVNAALSEQPRVMSASLENVPQRLRMAVAIANYVAESLPDRSSEAGSSQE